jgi:hypothetical protein
MTIQTEIAQEDWKAFCRFVARRAWKSRFPLSLLVIAVIAIALGLAFAGFGFELDAASYFAGLAAGVILLVSLSQLLARQMRPAEDGYVLGSQQIDVNDAGLRVISRRHEALFHQDAIRGLEVADKHIFVMADRNAGIIVPRRSFASEAEREQFVSEVRRRSEGLTP